MPDPARFLDVVLPLPAAPGVTLRYATVDPAYSSGQPKLTFDGEATLGARTWPRLGSYTPVAGDRVAVLVSGSDGFILWKIV